MIKYKTIIFSTLLIVALLSTSIFQLASVVSAQNPTIPVYLKVHAEPNPVGVGQPLYLSLFFTKPLPIIDATGGGSLTRSNHKPRLSR